LWPSETFQQLKNSPECVCGRGSAPDPAGGAYDAPPDLLVGCWGRCPFPIPSAFGVPGWRLHSLHRY